MVLNKKLTGSLMSLVLAISSPSGIPNETASASPHQLAQVAPTSVTDRLDSNSQVLHDGSYYNIHTFEGQAGEVINIELVSEEFDTYLILLGPDEQLVAEDDDGNGGTNSQIVVTLPTTGIYQILANAYGVGEIGQYTLTQNFASDDNGTSNLARLTQITPNSITGQLDENSETSEGGQYFDLHYYEGTAGETITFELDSEDFDAYLLLLGPSGEVISEDNNGGETTNARLTFELTATDTYTLVASTYSFHEKGEYTLAWRQGSEVERSLGRADFLRNQAFDLGSQGQFIEAEFLYREALSIRELHLSARHPDVAQILDELALLNRSQNKYEEAVDLYLRSLSILQAYRENIKASFPGSEDSYAPISFSGDYLNSERDLSRSLLRNIELRIGYILSDLSDIHLIRGDFEESENYRLACIEMFPVVCGYSLSVIEPLIEAIELSMRAEEYDKAMSFLENIVTIEDDEIITLDFFLASDLEKMLHVEILKETSDIAVSLSLESNGSQYPRSANLAIYTILKRKGLLLETQMNVQQEITSFIRQGSQPTSEEEVLLNQLLQSQRELANAYHNSSLQQDQNRIAELEADIDRIESELRNSENICISYFNCIPVASEDYHSALGPGDPSPYPRYAEEWNLLFYNNRIDSGIGLITERIPNKGAVVEYVRYQPFSYTEIENRFGSPRYAAYILFSDGRIEAIDLGSAAEIDATVQDFLELLQNRNADFQRAGARPTVRQADIEQMTGDLKALVFDPIAPYLQDTEHLLISPDGQLNLLPFEAMQTEAGGEYLVQQYQISYLNSGRDLLKFDVIEPSQNPAVIVANPDYETADGTVVAQGRSTSDNRRSTELSQLQVGPLPGTAAEAEAHSPLLPNAEIHTEDAATDNLLKSEQAPRSLHIATHGFFLSNVERPDRNAQFGAGLIASDNPLGSAITPGVVTENPLLRSGLALAGFNTRSSGSEDGVFTALEASQLNLFGTQLGVLSACDTGLGDISNGEGVYGLRRAFALAGAETQLLSLWQVSDFGTQSLMARYYENLTAGMGRSESLRQVQLEMIHSQSRYAHPFYWAAFITTGDWRPLE